MAFDAYDRSLDLLHLIAALLKKLAKHDADLTKQLRRAAHSVPLDIVEANRRTGLAYVERDEVAAAHAVLDRVRAMTYRLSR